MRVSGDNSSREQDLMLSRAKHWLRSASGLLIKLIGHKWFLTLVDQGIVSGTSFLVGIMIGRTCGKEQLGLYTLGISIIGLIIIVQESIICSPYAVFSPRLSGTAHSLYTGSTLLHQVALSGLAMMVLAGVGVFLSGTVAGGGLGAVVWTLLAVGSAITFREYVRQISFARLQTKTGLLMDGGVALVLISGIGLLAYLGKLSVFRAFAVIGAGCALAGLAWVMWTWKSLVFSIQQAVLDFRHHWSFGKWLLASNAALFFFSQLPFWFLIIFHGMAAVGIYAACQTIMALATPFLLGSSFFLKVKMAHVFTQGGIEQLRSQVIRATLFIVAPMSLLCAIIIVFGNQLLIFIYGPHYGGHSLILVILAFEALVDALEFGIYYGLLAMEQAGFVFKVTLLRVGIMLTIGCVLVKTWGPLGAAVGSLIAALVALLTQGFLIIKLFHSTNSPKKA